MSNTDKRQPGHKVHHRSEKQQVQSKKTIPFRPRTKKVKPPVRFLMPNRKKLFIVFVLILALFAGLIGRIVYLSTVYNDPYSKQVLSQLNYNSTTIPYRRGDILDRNGTVLATSEKVYNLILDSYVLTNSKVKEKGDCIDPTIDVLHDYFGLDKDEVEDYVEEHPESRYKVFKRKLTYNQLQPYYELMESEEERDLKISAYVKGIWFEDDYLRRYPYNTMACDLIGFTVSGNVGIYGVEQQYSDVLNGVDGREYGYMTGASNLERTTIAPVNGLNVVMTIDSNIQRIVEEKIWEFNDAIGSRNTSVIVMDPNNGEVLAMASYPIFNLNNPKDLSNYYTTEELREFTNEEVMICYNELWRNFSISDAYEPGSTAKVLTVAAALDEDAVKTSDTFYCDGFQQFVDGGGYTNIKCNVETGHGMLTLSESLMYSCNDALMQLVENLGKSNFIRYQSIFNLGQLTNIDLPGEASARTLLYYEDNMGPVELATNSFGQGYNATAIQMAAAFSSVVNGGNYYKPHVVKQITTESGSIVESMDAELMHTTVSKETSDWILDSLHKTVGKVENGVLLQGSAKYAYIEGYSIGGKTGTSEKKPIYENKCIVSLISCAPVENPEVVVYVVIDEPQTARQDASYLASIMSRKIYEDLLPYMQIFPEKDIEEETEPETEMETEPETETESETETETETETDARTETDTDEDDPDDETFSDDTDQKTNSSGSTYDIKADSADAKFVWKHLTEEEKDAIIYEYLYLQSNAYRDNVDVRPGYKTVMQLREKKAEEESKAAETADETEETDETGETDESETDASD